MLIFRLKHISLDDCRESPVVDNPKTLRNLIRNIGGGSSPILSRKSTSSIKKYSEAETNITKRANTKGRITSLSKSEAVAKRSTSCDSRLTRKRDSSVDTAREPKTKDKLDGSYILLSQVNITSIHLLIISSINLFKAKILFFYLPGRVYGTQNVHYSM